MVKVRKLLVQLFACSGELYQVRVHFDWSGGVVNSDGKNVPKTHFDDKKECKKVLRKLIKKARK